MYGASLRRLAPRIPDRYEARAGLGHREYGDPWTFGANVWVRGPVALISMGFEIEPAVGSVNYCCQRAILRQIGRELGIRRAWWIVDPRSYQIRREIGRAHV